MERIPISPPENLVKESSGSAYVTLKCGCEVKEDRIEQLTVYAIRGSVEYISCLICHKEWRL